MSPLYDFSCSKCGEVKEVYAQIGSPLPECCGEVMTRKYSVDKIIVKVGYPAFVDRIDEIHKAQEQRGERLRLPHPKTVRATV